MPVRPLFLTAALALCLVALTASGPSHTSSAATRQKAAPAAAGRFVVEYPPTKNKEYAAFQAELRKGRVLEGIVADLNSTFALPADIKVNFSECGQANAFYDPNRRSISMCYELVESFYDIFRDEEDNQEELDDAVAGATVFVFFHELGHALVDVLDLPVTGKEEDAVDQLSLFVLTDGTDDGEKAALDGARMFLMEGDEEGTKIDDLPFWDEHSLGQQRFYNIICGVYGQNPSKYEVLVTERVLPESRAERCEGEYQQIEKSWGRLLAPHIKADAK